MAYIGANEVREIRNELKKTFPTLKFSVRKDGYTSITVSIMKGDVDFSPILNGSGAVDVNHYHLGNYGKFTALFSKINDVIRSAPAKAKDGRAWYDNSDAMTDYFDTAFYYHITVGKWSKPYIKSDSYFDTMLRAAIDQGVEYSELNVPGTNLGYENAADDWLDLYKNVGVTDYENFLRVGKRWSNSEGETADRLWARIVDRDVW